MLECQLNYDRRLGFSECRPLTSRQWETLERANHRIPLAESGGMTRRERADLICILTLDI